MLILLTVNILSNLSSTIVFDDCRLSVCGEIAGTGTVLSSGATVSNFDGTGFVKLFRTTGGT
jgi:hypothetical protein